MGGRHPPINPRYSSRQRFEPTPHVRYWFNNRIRHIIGVMGKKIDQYRAELKKVGNWDDYLLENSGLPGPRGNIELAQAVVEEGEGNLFERYLSFSADKAPVNTPEEFLAFCGVLGMGKLIAEGQIFRVETLRTCANDPRWRIREAVAMGLQRWGRQDMDALLAEMKNWAQGNNLEKRAAAAGVCEPGLLTDQKQIEKALGILDMITSSIQTLGDRKTDDFIALRKGLGYCWSVAVVAYPERGKVYLEKWVASDDKDIRWIMHENLKKKRLIRMDASWVNLLQSRKG